MLKKILIIIGIFIVAVVILVGIGIYYFMPNEDIVLDYIKDHPEKAAIKLIRNDTLIAQKNAQKVMPLASTVKIILAIEYAKQSAKGLINPDQEIPLQELDKFYVPNTDGDAHPDWLKSVQDNIKDNKISIREIAKGMIKYSSNANTEWLSDKLGLENINNRLDSLGVEDHSEIYYFVSALFVGKEKFPDVKGEELVDKLRDLSMRDYIEITNQVHGKLLTDTTYKKDIGDLGMDIQRVWSDNLPSSTVAEYVEIMEKINSRTYFSAETQMYLDEVMEFLLENPANRKWLEHSGMKGGSTAFVLTKALYATDKKENKTELAYFFNNLGTLDKMRLQMSMNSFDLKILTNDEFREKVERELEK